MLVNVIVISDHILFYGFTVTQSVKTDFVLKVKVLNASDIVSKPIIHPFINLEKEKISKIQQYYHCYHR